MSSTEDTGAAKTPRTQPGKAVAPVSKDPEVLAAEIARTREDLAETLDAIADKVSPKRVVERTRKKVADAVSDVVGQVKEAAVGAKEAVGGAAETALDAAQDRAPNLGTPTVADTSVFPVEGPAASGRGVPREVLAGGILGIVVLVIVRRRRRARRGRTAPTLRRGAAARGRARRRR